MIPEHDTGECFHPGAFRKRRGSPAVEFASAHFFRFGGNRLIVWFQRDLGHIRGFVPGKRPLDPQKGSLQKMASRRV